MIRFHTHGDELSCCGQIDVHMVAEFAAQGYRSLICNRPDTEQGAIASADIAKAAKAHGLIFVYQPVEFSKLSAIEGEVFAHSIDALPKPVLAYCRTGRRSAALWALARAPRLGTEAVLTASRQAGCDLEELRPRLPMTSMTSMTSGADKAERHAV